MARFKADMKLRGQIERELKKIAKRNETLLRAMVGNDEASAGARALLDGGLLMAARAKEIITEKGHIVTGNLRRSINAQLQTNVRHRLEVEVGTFVHYAPFVEALPDGGYLFPASEETFPTVVQIFEERGVNAVLVRWAS